MGTIGIGIDLAASATGKSWSAVAVLGDQGKLREPPCHFKRAADLMDVLSRYDLGEAVVAVDAPRSVPDCSAENYAYRSCEKAVKAVDPGAGAFYGAAALFVRWYEIEAQHLRGFTVIETYPRVVWKRLGLPGRPKGFRKVREEVWAFLERLVGASCKGFSPHQVDAVLCAYTALCFGRGEVDWYGEPGQGAIFIPAPGKHNTVPPEVLRIDEKFRRFPSMAGWP